MESVPQLGGNEDLFARNARSLDAFTNFGLVLIDQSTVNVPITLLKGNSDSVADLTRRSQPCT